MAFLRPAPQTTPEVHPPKVSVIVITLNEAENLEDAASSLLAQDVPLEVLVVDGGSTDGTAEIAQRLAARHPDRVRLVASRPLPVGPARNLGIAAARSDVVAFMSADATAAPGWARTMLGALADADVVYGRQEHTPARLSVAAVLRGLRYHHFRRDREAAPETYASNVNAAAHRAVFSRLRYVEDPDLSALDDILFTHEANELGLRVAYARHAVVRHKDAQSLAVELAKNRREGYGWGLLAPVIGWNRPVLFWGILLLAGLVLVTLRPAWWSLGLWAGVLFLPTLRRAVLGSAPYLRRPHALVAAIAVSPFLDLVFLLYYLRGAATRGVESTGRADGEAFQAP